MSQRKETTRRHRGADSDDDDDDNVPQTAPVATAEVAVAAKAPAAAAFVDPSAGVAAPAPPRAKAPSSAAVAPAAAPSAPAGAASTTAAATAAAASTTADSVKLLFEADYQTMQLEELLTLLKTCEKKKLEEMKTEREVARQQAEQLRQNNRIERFFELTAEEASHANVGSSAGLPVSEENFQGKGYRYEYMLTCIHNTLTKNNKGTKLNERNQLPAPQIEMIGKKKTIIINFGRLCDAFHRSPEEVKEFIEQELSVTGNLDSKSALILKYQARKANDFDKLFIRYLDEYVKCNACHQIDSTLTKENRILTLHCNRCTATRTVNVSHDNTYSASVEKRSIKRNAITL